MCIRDRVPTGLIAANAILVGTDGGRLEVEITVSEDAPNLIEGLSIGPQISEFPGDVTVEAIDVTLADLAPQSSLAVFDVTDGACEIVHEIRADEQILLGSVFKLWVLAALAHEVSEGNAGWDETLAVTDELRSNPAGEIYQLESGTEVSLEELAELMISISDNTATDMLLDRLGRDSVGTVLERVGVADPSANRPMLSTGNLFALKFDPAEPTAADYRTLDEAGRRALLAELDAAVHPWVAEDLGVEDFEAIITADGAPPIDQPRDFDLEWFATPLDLCRTLVYLSELADTEGLEPVAPILELNAGQGLPFDRERWPTIRFKGGSEPGVLAGAWWFEGNDGQRHVVAGGANNPAALLDETAVVLTLASAIELVR